MDIFDAGPLAGSDEAAQHCCAARRSARRLSYAQSHTAEDDDTGRERLVQVRTTAAGYGAGNGRSVRLLAGYRDLLDRIEDEGGAHDPALGAGAQAPAWPQPEVMISV